MRPNWKIIGSTVVGLVLVLVAVRSRRDQPSAVSIPAPAQLPRVAQTPVAPQPPMAPAPEVQQPTPKLKTTTKALAPIPASAQNNNATRGKEPLRDPDARDALALVGTDPDAEQYWLASIFDTTLPDNERADLMEDLNETGFNDPKNLTANDLSLIASRLEIINSILPKADDFMAEHLLEAQKDLANMFAQVTGQQ